MTYYILYSGESDLKLEKLGKFETKLENILVVSVRQDGVVH